MAAISRFIEGQPAILLAHAFIIVQGSDALQFEVLEVNATSLHKHIGVKQLLTCDGDEPFWGELIDLQPCTPTATGLALLRDRPALRGTVKIYSGEPQALQ